MAIFDPIPRADLGTKFTHYGWFCGLCPVYLADPEGESPIVVERNWVPAWWLTITEMLFGIFIFVNTAINPEYEPLFPIAISGSIDRSNKA